MQLLDILIHSAEDELSSQPLYEHKKFVVETTFTEAQLSYIFM